MILALALACSGSDALQVGTWRIQTDRDQGSLSIEHSQFGSVLEDVRPILGDGIDDARMSFGSFEFQDDEARLRQPQGLGKLRGRGAPYLIELLDGDGAGMGFLTVVPISDRTLRLELSGTLGDNRAGLSAACDADDHFLGTGGHAWDVDHVGEAYALWVSEPGVGKTEDDELPADWFIQGTRHSSSTPIPWLLRPHRGQGLLTDTSARVEVDLCATDPDRFQALGWNGTVAFVVVAAPDAVGAVQALTSYTGRQEVLPEPWVFAPWNDQVFGADEVTAAASDLRGAGAPGSVMWTEDWKGGDVTPNGYRLSGEWTVDTELYPDAAGQAAALHADGYEWFAYFSPFVREGYGAYDDALAAGAMIRDDEGEPYLFSSATLGQQDSLVDLSTATGREWAKGKMQGAVDLGFRGWMADFAEWMPTDARLASGEDPWMQHNLYPEQWQRISREVLEPAGGVFFARSAWTRTSGIAPIVWGGDQRTSFDADDGFPTVVAMGAGLGASGIPVFTHDIAGYNSVGNPPSTKELWFRWSWLGAFSPIMRTHHGAFAENWNFHSDAETLQHWTRASTEHMRTWPYRYGLARRAYFDGVPMLMPIAFRYGDDWARTDAWLLGDALLVAPVLEQGQTSRHVDLPGDGQWYDWFTHEPVSSGTFDADMSEIPVFAASQQTVPVFTTVPDTLVDTDNPDLVTLAQADTERTVLLFGGGGTFTEGDGTTYSPTGTPTGAAEVTETLSSGTIDVAGVSLHIDGDTERAYTVVVIP